MKEKTPINGPFKYVFDRTCSPPILRRYTRAGTRGAIWKCPETGQIERLKVLSNTPEDALKKAATTLTNLVTLREKEIVRAQAETEVLASLARNLRLAPSQFLSQLPKD